MQSKYVNQCSCCGKRFIRLELNQWLPEHLEGEIVEMLDIDMEDLFLNGQYCLTYEDEFITGFYYEFRTAEEEHSAEDLAWSVNSISNYLYDFYVSDARKVADEEYAD